MFVYEHPISARLLLLLLLLFYYCFIIVLLGSLLYKLLLLLLRSGSHIDVRWLCYKQQHFSQGNYSKIESNFQTLPPQIPYSGKVWQIDSFRAFGERKFG